MKSCGYNSEEIKVFRKLSTPAKVQDFLNSLPFNFERKGETCMSPSEVLRAGKAHCVEGAILAAAILEFHGAKPLILDLRSTHKPFDFDHVVAVFEVDGYYGALSKTNHSVLRYREPIYKTLRELALSYFHEYFLDDGRKTLREYSDLLDLNKFNKQNWRTSKDNLFEIPEYLDRIKHYKILNTKQVRNLRLADKVEIKAGEIVEYSNE